jgi:hypothetical protein
MKNYTPGHPALDAVEDSWHKIVALILAKYVPNMHAEITLQDIEKSIGLSDKVVSLEERGETIHVKVILVEEAERLAEEWAKKQEDGN